MSKINKLNKSILEMQELIKKEKVLLRSVTGRRLKKLRLAMKLKRPQLAQEIGTSPTYIERIESAAVKINTDVLISLCTFFNVSADYLIGISDAKNDKTDLVVTRTRDKNGVIEVVSFPKKDKILLTHRNDNGGTVVLLKKGNGDYRLSSPMYDITLSASENFKSILKEYLSVVKEQVFEDYNYKK